MKSKERLAERKGTQKQSAKHVRHSTEQRGSYLVQRLPAPVHSFFDQFRRERRRFFVLGGIQLAEVPRGKEPGKQEAPHGHQQHDGNRKEDPGDLHRGWVELRRLHCGI